MGWLGSKFQGWATKTQKRELEDFVAKLRVMDGSEIAFVLAVATDHRIRMLRLFALDLLQPLLVLRAEPAAALRVGGLIKDMQANGQQALAAGMMVWLHTLRASGDLDLRQGGRDMWGQLARGVPDCEAAAVGFRELTGTSLDLTDYDLCPEGLTPQPL